MASEPVCLADFEDYARDHLPKYAFEYFAAGANDQYTTRENVEAFKRLRIKPRILRGISQADISTTVLGQKIAMPVGISPSGHHKLAHPDGELATARGAAKARTCMILSSVGSTALEDVTLAAPDSLKWMQLYIFRSREMTCSIVQRAEKAGFKAVVVTVDGIVIGKRLADFKYHSLLQPHFMNMPNINPAQISDHAKRSSDFGQSEHGSGSAFNSFANSVVDPSISFEIVDWLKSITKLPIVLKGILTADDAREAIEHGVHGVIVSNTGGRQLDYTPATIDVLGEIVEAVEGKAEVYIDGGIRTGTDVLKALALGARAVFIGRPAVWGLATKGEEGVFKVLDILKDELQTAMMLSGCATVTDIKPSLIMRNPSRL